jgi:hypothetical protein|tara:strand:+ start:166 stop:393 length:228 start_codon:yes stop_codon:yes gene_type:complete
MSKFYTVHDTGQNLLKVIDNETGSQAGMISPRGKLVTPPIVNGTQVSFVVETPDGTKMGTVHNLPSGQLVNQFRA